MFNERGRRLLIQICAILVVAFVIQSFQGLIFRSPLALAAVDELRGWAWSSNIGWVSFNCADTGGCLGRDYKVRVNSGTGNLSGYAWSSNIGWIRFDPAGPYPAAGPSYPAKVDDPAAASSPLSGWARALSYNVGNGEWDGWINMNGVSVSGGEFSGFAWGSDVVGWLNFEDVTTLAGGGPPANCIFTASPDTIVVQRPGEPGYTRLDWQCQNVNSCSIDPGNFINLRSTDSSRVTLSETTTYFLSCEGGGGARATASVKVRVFLPNRIEVRP